MYLSFVIVCSIPNSNSRIRSRTRHLYVQVPQWTDDWAVCAVDIPDAKCHWYVQQADNTFGEGFDWETAPWFDVNGLNDVPAMQASTVVEKLQEVG